MSHHRKRWIVAGLIVGLVPLSACTGNDAPAAHKEHPAHVEHIDGSDLGTVTLTSRAMERIGLETSEVREEQTLSTRLSKDGQGWNTHKVVPYSSLIYDPQGRTWIYTSPDPRSFVRHEVDVFRIVGDDVLLSDGPAVGTAVASVGAAELYGAEFEVGH